MSLSHLHLKLELTADEAVGRELGLLYDRESIVGSLRTHASPSLRVPGIATTPVRRGRITNCGRQTFKRFKRLSPTVSISSIPRLNEFHDIQLT